MAAQSIRVPKNETSRQSYFLPFTPPVCTEDLIRVDAVMESPKLAE
jgi:hypothetical protein